MVTLPHAIRNYNFLVTGAGWTLIRLGRAATRSVALMLLLTLLVMLFCRGLIESDEGRYAEIPREMAASGNWMEIRLLGFRYYEKPPLTYWLTAPAIVACGARDWAVRIPLALNLLGIAWLFYRLMRREWSPLTAASSFSSPLPH